MYVVTPRCAAAAVVSAVVLRRPTQEYTHPYSMMHRRLDTAGIEVAPHYHQLLVPGKILLIFIVFYFCVRGEAYGPSTGRTPALSSREYVLLLPVSTARHKLHLASIPRRYSSRHTSYYRQHKLQLQVTPTLRRRKSAPSMNLEALTPWSTNLPCVRTAVRTINRYLVPVYIYI